MSLTLISLKEGIIKFNKIQDSERNYFGKEMKSLTKSTMYNA